MNVVNQKKYINFDKKAGGRGMKIIQKKERKDMSGKEYAKYIFWIALTAILLSTLAGS